MRKQLFCLFITVLIWNSILAQRKYLPDSNARWNYLTYCKECPTYRTSYILSNDSSIFINGTKFSGIYIDAKYNDKKIIGYIGEDSVGRILFKPSNVYCSTNKDIFIIYSFYPIDSIFDISYFGKMHVNKDIDSINIYSKNFYFRTSSFEKKLVNCHIYNISSDTFYSKVGFNNDGLFYFQNYVREGYDEFVCYEENGKCVYPNKCDYSADIENRIKNESIDVFFQSHKLIIRNENNEDLYSYKLIDVLGNKRHEELIIDYNIELPQNIEGVFLFCLYNKRNQVVFQKKVVFKN